MTTADDDRQARRERRAWIRENHPDRGGDAATFGQGMPGAGARRRADLPEVRRTRKVRRALKRRVRSLATLLTRKRRRPGRVL